ncbi:MAG TPA: RDD family protein, partial [Polyangiaceae bacterium]|nr:RDD family protein [Polyangiaceae bacterium]
MAVAPLYRTFWRRFWSGNVDGLIFLPLREFDSLIAPHLTTPIARTAWFVLVSSAFPAYSVYMHGRFGQTLGKRFLRVKVTDLAGGPLTMGQAFRRELINLAFTVWSVMLGAAVLMRGGNRPDPTEADLGPAAGIAFGLFGLELLSTLGSSKRRALHDLIAGSVVVRVGADADDTLSDRIAAGDVELETSHAPSAGEFACTSCTSPVTFGASHCHACG